MATPGRTTPALVGTARSARLGLSGLVVVLAVAACGAARATASPTRGVAQLTATQSVLSEPSVSPTPETTPVPSLSELPSPSLQLGFFRATGSTHSILEPDVQAVRLQDGRVLVIDFGDAELYDPSSGTFSVTGPESPARWAPSVTLLQDGEVLVAGGGAGADGKEMYKSAELYNPRTGKFTSTGSMKTAREEQSATLLSDGEVLIAGGDNTTGVLASAELYNPRTGRFTPAGSLPAPRDYHTATLLNDGRVLFAGGYTSFDRPPIAAADLYDPRTGRFSTAGSMKTGRAFGTATRLADGRVLFAGGTPDPLVGATTSVSSAEVFDPRSNEFTPTGSMSTARMQGSAALLLDGRVLVAGGWDSNGPSNPDGTTNLLASAETYDPTSGTFSTTGPMAVGRIEQAAALLKDGQTLIVGGDTNGSTAELYTP